MEEDMLSPLRVKSLSELVNFIKSSDSKMEKVRLDCIELATRNLIEGIESGDYIKRHTSYLISEDIMAEVLKGVKEKYPEFPLSVSYNGMHGKVLISVEQIKG